MFDKISYSTLDQEWNMINMNTKGKKKSHVNSFPPLLSCNSPILFLNKTLQVHAPSAMAFRY